MILAALALAAAVNAAGLPPHPRVTPNVKSAAPYVNKPKSKKKPKRAVPR